LPRINTPSSYPAPMPPSFHAGPMGAPRPQRPSQISAVPGAPSGAPEPPRDRPSAPANIPRPAAGFSHLTIVILVVLAATAAAVTVYIVLSRLT
ncbi:MAG TPA: hypothetical protein VIX73_13345, partial [Kofleriaceae bacterium]